MSRTETAPTPVAATLPPPPKPAADAVRPPVPTHIAATAEATPRPKTAPETATAPSSTTAAPAAQTAAGDAGDEEKPAVPASPATIDMEQFGQILDLDGEDPECEFSASMVGAYFGQAASTFKEMDEALTDSNLAKLSELGHFLKGSSAQLGVSHVQVSCEKIQHYGQLKDQEKNIDLSDAEALGLIGSLMDTVKLEYSTAETWLKDYFKQKGVDVPVEEAD